MTIANLLTLLRLFICPFFLLIYIYPEWFHVKETGLPYVLLLLFVLSEISDAMDGYLARKFGEVTELGKILDPMADSIARTSAFLTFTQPPVSLPVLLVFIFIYRDSVVSTLRTICALKGFVLAARVSGKIKAVIQAAVIFVILTLLIPHSKGELGTAGLQFWSTLLVSIAALYTIFSCVEYILVNRRYIARLLRKKVS